MLYHYFYNRLDVVYVFIGSRIDYSSAIYVSLLLRLIGQLELVLHTAA